VGSRGKNRAANDTNSNVRKKERMTSSAPGIDEVESLVGRDDVIGWRRRRLIDAGFPHRLALSLAATPGIDLHALLELVDRGCPPELAARILSPVSGGLP
jgi:hypothetical protein